MAVKEHMGNLGARGIEQQDRRIMDRAELLAAMEKMRLFIEDVLYRTSDTWMGKYLHPAIHCSKCGDRIPECDTLSSKLDMSVANEGFGNGGAVWTCPKCAHAE